MWRAASLSKDEGQGKLLELRSQAEWLPGRSGRQKAGGREQVGGEEVCGRSTKSTSSMGESFVASG